MSLKNQVQAYWEAEPCDFRHGTGGDPLGFFREISRKRYELESLIPDFADFGGGSGKRVLEVGVGLGVDFWGWVGHEARATGIDLTSRAVKLTRSHLDLRQIPRAAYNLSQGDAETLPFRDRSFDLVYSWGALHHTPRTDTAFREIRRVLAPGGLLKAMVYHVPCWTGWLLWGRFGLLAGKPSRRVKDLIYEHLESPGTKAYTDREVHQLLKRAGFGEVRTRSALGPTDLLSLELSPRYRSPLYRISQKLYPRWLVKALGHRFGLLILIEAEKPKQRPAEEN
jgi:ubiquinone/menaquinone biosynthesis C-methylase UbiE